MQPSRASSSDRFASVPGAESRPAQTKRIGIYELLAEIGEGASATVFLARTPKGDLVAVKVLKREDAGHPEARERFSREALISSRIEHHGVVRALDAGEDHGLPYIVMEYVAGVSLQGRLTGGALAVPEATRILGEVARAMHAAHGAGVIHRDLKPANILLDRAGNPRVSDFGLARDQYAGKNLTREGDLIGTPYYMSPEQVRGEPPTAATDAWGLGVLLYECLTGVRPFEGSTVAQVAKKILNDQPIAPSRVARQQLPPALDLVVAAALSKDPRRRPSMDALARDLDALATGNFEARRRGPSFGGPVFLLAAAAAGFSVGAGGVAMAVAARTPRYTPPVDTRPLTRQLETVAAAVTALRVSLDRATKEKAEAEQRVAALEAATRSGPASRDLLRFLGEERLAASRNLPIVIDRTLRDLEALPVTNATLALRARLLNHRGRFRETIALVRQQGELDDFEVLRLHGEALVAVRDEEAKAVLRRVAEQDAEGARGLYVKARVTPPRTAEDIERACGLLDRAIAVDPSFGAAAAEKAFLLAQLVLRSPKDFDPALAAANRAIAMDPTCPRAWFARSFVTWNAICYRQEMKETVPEGLVSGTNSDLRAAFALDNNWEFLVYIGKTYALCGRPLEAYAELDHVIDRVPRGEPVRTFALAWRGNARMIAGDEAAAVDDWLAAFAAGPREIANQCATIAVRVKDDTRRRQLQNAGLELRRQ